MKSILLIKKLLGLVEMTSGLRASCKLDFLSTPNNIIITRVFNVSEIKKSDFCFLAFFHTLWNQKKFLLPV